MSEKMPNLQGETPEQIKARLDQEGKKVLTGEEYLEALKKKNSEEAPAESEEDPFEGAVISGKNRDAKEDYSYKPSEMELERQKRRDNDPINIARRRILEQIENMTPEEKKAHLAEQAKVDKMTSWEEKAKYLEEQRKMGRRPFVRI